MPSLLEAPACRQAEGPDRDSATAGLRRDKIADGVAPRVGAQVEPDRADVAAGGRVRDRELVAASVVPGLERHQDEAPGVRLDVGYRDDRNPALDLRVLAGGRDGRSILGPEGPEGDDAVAERWIGRGESVGHGPKYAPCRGTPVRLERAAAGRPRPTGPARTGPGEPLSGPVPAPADGRRNQEGGPVRGSRPA